MIPDVTRPAARSDRLGSTRERADSMRSPDRQPRRDSGSGRTGPRATSGRAADVLRPAFKRFLWNSYDHIGLLVLANLLWFALLIPVVTAPAATAGLFQIARKISDHEPAAIRDFFEGFRRHFAPALRAGAITLGLAVVLWVNVDFYSHLHGRASVPGMLLAAIMVWLALFLLLIQAHLFPLIVGGERSTRQAFRKAALLTLDNPGYTIGLTIQAISVAALCVLTGAGLVLAIGSLLAVLLSTGHRELLKKYFPDSPAASEPEETRTLGDAWRPWEPRRRK
jgi:uncharacterized membrane protein YesL